jgi:hypothetical protein
VKKSAVAELKTPIALRSGPGLKILHEGLLKKSAGVKFGLGRGFSGCRIEKLISSDGQVWSWGFLGDAGVKNRRSLPAGASEYNGPG